MLSPAPAQIQLQSGATTASPRTQLQTSTNKGEVTQQVQPPSTDESQYEMDPKTLERRKNSGKNILVRMTGFDESLELSPQVNLNAFQTAIALQDIGVQVTIYLDQRAVMFATQFNNPFMVDNQPVDFHKLMNQFLALKGKVLVSKKFADKYALTQKATEQVSFADDADVAREIAVAQKVMDFTGPIFPSLYQGPVDASAIVEPGESIPGIARTGSAGKHSGK
jgi:hypothetical protein